jgi:hypothetical protein
MNGQMDTRNIAGKVVVITGEAAAWGKRPRDTSPAVAPSSCVASNA